MAGKLLQFNPGDKFNRLTVIRFVDTVNGYQRCLFMCDCGKEHIAKLTHVKAGSVKSCGCRGRIEGRCFRCQVDKPPDEFHKKSGGYHRTICKDCVHASIRKDIRSSPELRERERQRSRRKYNRDKIKPGFAERERENSIRLRKTKPGRLKSIFRALKQSARKRGIPFALSVSDIEARFEQHNWICERTGIAFEITAGEGRKPFAPSVDRIDNSRGYEPDNIQVVIWLYNLAKNKFTDADVLTFAYALIEHQQKSTINRLKLRIVK